MVLSYDGSAYNGWQKQGNTGNTIQEKLEKILSALLRQPVSVIGSGRTDAGVHALAQVANFHADTELSPEWLCYRLREQLPKDICLRSFSEVGERFHARLNASGKTYAYHIRLRQPDVFRRQYEWLLTEAPDAEKMRHAAELFLGEHDFRAFSSFTGKKSTVRRIDTVEISESGNELVLRFSGNGFLYHMVRKLTGILVEIGLGNENEAHVKELLYAGAPAINLPTAPAKGLFLEEVRYDEYPDIR